MLLAYCIHDYRLTAAANLRKGDKIIKKVETAFSNICDWMRISYVEINNHKHFYECIYKNGDEKFIMIFDGSANRALEIQRACAALRTEAWKICVVLILNLKNNMAAYATIRGM